MAIIVPILLSYTGAAAAIGTAVGISATAVTAIASVAFQVSGINNKINKAASKVFGEDLVMIANVAGAVYGAVNGGFGGGGAEGAAGLTEAGGALSTKAMLDGTTAFGANSAAGAFDLVDGVGALTTGDFSGTTDSLGNSTYSPGDSFNLTEMAKTTPDGVGIAASTPDASQGMNLLKGTQTTGTDTKALVDATKAAENTGAARDIAAAPSAAKAAAAPVAAPAAQTTAAAPGAAGVKAAAGAATKPGSFFDKLLSNDKAVGEVIKGVGTGIVGAAQSKAEKEKLAWQKQRYTATPTTRIVQ